MTLNLEEHSLPDGRKGTYEIVRHPGGAAVLPILADGRVLLIRQFRPAAGGWVVELPAGRLEEGEEPAATAGRELEEETGYRAGGLEPLGSVLSSVGFCDERIHLFVARDLTAGECRREPDEAIELFALPLQEALAQIAAGAIDDAKTQLALLRYAGLSAAQSAGVTPFL